MVLKELNEVLRFKNASDLAMAKPEKTADFSRLHSTTEWFPHVVTSEKRAQKFHTASDWLKICFNQSEAFSISG